MDDLFSSADVWEDAQVATLDEPVSVELLLRQSDIGVDTSDGRGHLSAAVDNPTMLARIVDLYGLPGMTIIDPMVNRGVFWQKVDRTAYDLRLSDIAQGGPDARALPYGDDSAHMVVLDPPYRYVEARTGGTGLLMLRTNGYNLQSVRVTDLEQPRGFDAVMALYLASITEALRVLATGGYLVVKCQDTISDGHQRWVHVDLMADLATLGAPVIDLGVVTPPQVPPTRWKHQRSLRKAHSYFLVARKGGRWPFGYRSVGKR